MLALLAVAVYGAAELAFLCDDAYIHFRYVANAHAGHGLVWNAPPFAPVEGNGFLWTMVLWAIWSWFGIEPPAAANPVSIALGCVQVLLLAFVLLRLRGRTGARLPAVVGLTALVAIVGNRTFLQWMSGGLDTALCNTPFLAWVLLAFRAPERRDARWLVLWSSSAALTVLARPDGLPAVAATVAIAALLVWQRRMRLRDALVGALPLLMVAAHLVWRRWFYGEWLPNTFYAKVVEAWPEAGLRYFGCFALENGAWLWFPIAALWLLVECVRSGRAIPGLLWRGAPAVAAVLVVGFHAAYYVLRVGGDHFEYRVLSHLVPLGVLACVVMAARCTASFLLPMAAAASLGLASTFSWLHFGLTRDPTCFGLQTLTPQVPAVLQPITRWFDRQQLWLFSRFVGLRCFFHACVMHQNAHLHYPTPMRIDAPPDAFPIAYGAAIGYLGWQLRDVAILDLHGLNDWVIARSPHLERNHTATRQRLHAELPAADLDRDGVLTIAELQSVLAASIAGQPHGSPAAFLLGLAAPLFAAHGKDGLTVAAAGELIDLLVIERLMAHDRWPPPNYIEAFAPNVTIAGGVATATARSVPMTADRIRAIEAEWRQRLRAR